jgi:hypothetical protein
MPTILTPHLNLSQKIVLRGLFIAFLGLVLSCSVVEAQQASLKIQRNIVERIERIDQFLHDTISPDKLSQDQRSWQNLEALQDTVKLFRADLQQWFSLQDSSMAVIAAQQNSISTQQKMIDALNWQVKESLRENLELSTALAAEKQKNEQLKASINQLELKTQKQEESLTALMNSLELHQAKFDQIIDFLRENQQLLKQATQDSAKTSPEN